MNFTIIKKDSPLSFLQQRIDYADLHSSRPYVWLLENVPKWPQGQLPEAKSIEVNATTYGHCQGSFQLREQICKRELERYGLSINPSQILVTNGAFHGISLVSRYLAKTKGVALCRYPILNSIDTLIRAANFETRELKFCNDKLDELALEEQCRSGVDLIYLNIPHNPTGEVMNQDDLNILLKIAKKYGAVVFADLVYDSFVFKGSRAMNPLLYTQSWDNLFVFNSMSKNYGLPGIRIGWIVSSEKHIEQLSSRLESECISVCNSSQLYASELIEYGNTELVQHVKNNWVKAPSWLSELPDVNFSIPSGGTQYFLEIPVNDIEIFADFMLVKHGLILATSGNYVGEARECIRFPIGQDPSVLANGLSLLKKGLIDWKGFSTLRRSA